MKKILSLFTLILFMLAPAQGKMKNYTQIMSSKNIYEIDAFLRDANEHDPRRNILKNRLVDLINRYIATAYPDDQSIPKLQEKLALLKRNPSTRISFEEMSEKIKQKRRKYYEEQLAELNNPKKAKPKNINEVAKGNDNSASYADAVARAKAQRTTAEKNSSNIGNSGTTTASTNASSLLSKSEESEFDMLMNESPVEHKAKTVQILNKLFDNDPSSKDCIVMIQNKTDCNMIMRIEGIGNFKYRLAIPANDEGSVVVQKGDYLFSSLVCGAQYASQKTVQKAMMVSLKNPGK